MSGICGIVTFDGSAVVRGDVDAMVGATPWRGPVVTCWRGDGALLASQQHPLPHLSTSDVAADGGIVVLADARIDNRAELASSLRAAGWHTAAVRNAEGHGVAPHGDAHLLAIAFRCWGSGFVERLIGDFSVVVWDTSRRRVVFARDPMGMRPLYFRAESRTRIIVASEAKQILCLPTVDRGVNEAAVAAYLLADTGLRGDESYWQQVSQLEEGHVLVCDASQSSRRRYWDADPGHRIFHPDRRTASEHLAQVLTDAVAARLDRSSAPAIMLSGGMDSGTVAAIAGTLHSRSTAAAPVSAYTWAFDQLTECDERHLSRRIVEPLGLRPVDVPADDAGPLDGYPDHDVDLDDPVVGAFQTVIDRTLDRARDDGMDLMLGGDRGDLVLGPTAFGYLSLMLERRWTAVRGEIAEHRRTLHESVPRILREDVVAPLGYRMRRRDAAGWLRWLGARLHGGRAAASDHPPWVRPALANLAERPAPSAPGVPVEASRLERYESIFTPLHLRGMIWSERTYAQRGISFADPFSDRRVVELVLAMPQSLVGRPNDHSKPLLRDAMRGIMPEPARTAATKILPTPLYIRGLRRNHDTVKLLCTDSHADARGWLDSRALFAHYEAWRAGAPLDSSFWYALSVERWLRVVDASK